MRKIVVAVAALAFLAPSSAQALAFVGARVGYAMPSGDAQKDQPMKDTVASAVPVQVDAGLSMLNILSLGVYGSYGPVQLKSAFKDVCSSCSATNLRAGVQVNLRPPLVLKELWGGVFAGYEQEKLKGGGGGDVKMSGWEAGLQAGWDFSILPFIGIGPYVSYSIAQFTSFSGVPETSKAQHQALTVGLRGIFDL